MKRELRFRAWLPSIKKMTYSHTLEELIQWGAAKGIGDVEEWMQFTGVKDVKGTDIYDGDIIKFQSGGSYYTSTVWYDEKSAAYLVKGEFEMLFVHAKKHAEVIGSIYENPELLK